MRKSKSYGCTPRVMALHLQKKSPRRLSEEKPPSTAHRCGTLPLPAAAAAKELLLLRRSCCAAAAAHVPPRGAAASLIEVLRVPPRGAASSTSRRDATMRHHLSARL